MEGCPNGYASVVIVGPGVGERVLINEGGKRLFFFSWIFFHCLVIAFGFMNYQLSDDLSNARATFGITYCQYFYFIFKMDNNRQSGCRQHR